MNKNYEQLKEAIQKAVPEIMELNLGCEVELNGDKEIVGDCVKFVSNKSYFFEGCGCCSGYLKPQTLKILGRPITLCNVLVAVKKDAEGLGAGEHMIRIGNYLQVFGLWNLKDNNLDNQSGECKEFLIKLLTK